MKNLFEKSLIALVMLSMFGIACEKEKPAPPPQAIATVFVKTTYVNDKGESRTTGDIVIPDGAAGGDYVFDPTLHGALGDIKCNCHWSFKIVATTGYIAYQDPATGKVTIWKAKKGTYTVTITYKCDDGTSSSRTVTVTVK
jgi:hypothetical protein